MKIIGISGKKQSGKNTMANFINGVVLKKMGAIDDFSISEYGELVIETIVDDAVEEGVLDVTRKDATFVNYAEVDLWPYVKIYSFADGLKTLCMDFFDLSFEQVYGTDEQKNTETNVYWSDLPTPNTQIRSKKMTARELLQYFGTDIMRRMNTNVWVNHAIRTIKKECSQIAIIPDVRFPNEVNAIKEAGGKVVRLERQFKEDAHSSECALDKENYDWNNFDLIIDNSSGGTQEFIDEVAKSIRALEL
tara:strand:- start:392 stop:1135 length:744 start_codon:yes stop_codon:yes gene_type:complete